MYYASGVIFAVGTLENMNLGFFTDPGTVPHNAFPLTNGLESNNVRLSRCGICDAYKPWKAHHCSFVFLSAFSLVSVIAAFLKWIIIVLGSTIV